MIIFTVALAVGAITVLVAQPNSDTSATDPSATSDSAVGPLYDPVRAGEQTPSGYRPILDRDTIRPIYDPSFVTASESGWTPSTLVLGVSLDGEAKAYPIVHLNFREMVIDELAGKPILVTWCPLCGTAMAHSRVVDGETLVFGNQGHLWQNAMTWYDHGTGSIWSQPLGEAILGPLAGTRLERVPSTLTSWTTWLERNPETLALDAPGEPSSYRLTDMVLVVELDDETVGYPFDELRDVEVVNDVVNGIEIAVVVDPENLGGWTVFARQVNGQTLTLERVDGELIDLETGTVWDPVRGTGLEGELAGELLPPIPGFTVFPRDFDSFWPEGRIWSLDGS
ncbi:MAG: DUF3179 domain-containing (seleno)protein [Acidimicrobiia bacterium]